MVLPRRALASILAASLAAGAPGAQAWGQVAAIARPGSMGAGLSATSTRLGAAPCATPSLAISAPSLAPGLFNPPPIAASAALVPLPLVPAALPADPAAVLSAAAARLNLAETKTDGALGRLSAIFDGNGPMSEPSLPDDPNPAPVPAAATASPPAPARKPFIPATRVVAELEKLFKADPDAGLKAAAAAILDKTERRSEVKIGALRILDSSPIGPALPHYLSLLKLTYQDDVQAAKATNTDPWWYLQRAALTRLSREAAALEPTSPPLLYALKSSYRDRNPSVRLAAAAALSALDVSPGPEVSYDDGQLQPEKAKSLPRRILHAAPWKYWLTVLSITAALGAWLAYAALAPAPPANPPVSPPAITQPAKAPDSAAKAAPPATGGPAAADAADSHLARIARDAKRAADAAERMAKAAEDLAKLNETAKAPAQAAKPKESPRSSLLSIFLVILAATSAVGLFFWLARRWLGGGAAGTAPTTNSDKPTTRFDAIAGMDESLIEVQEIIDFLRDPRRFDKLGARMPKGILLEGPPGTGKTLLARALAGETNATFIPISGSDFVEMYVGVGARRVRDLFARARKSAPAIIFIDEIDAVGKKRGEGGPNGNDEREQTINQILKEMDGFDNSSGVLVIAATNRSDTLDPALTRPGRFDRKIHVGLPQALGREAILALHAKKARLSVEADLRLIARRTAGLSGAFLENVINEAALLAARRDGDAIGAADMDEAVDRATIGGKRSLRLSESVKLRLAAHEAGHVLANLLNEKAELRVPVNKVTIIPHGSGALGFAETGSEDGDAYLYTRGELEARLDTALGGLVAEKIFYGEWSTGPGSDLEAATRVARAMVQQFGMSAELGLAQTAPTPYGQSAFGGDVDSRAHAEINKLLKDSMARTETRLRAGADRHKGMIEALLEKETLSADEIEAIAHPKTAP